MSDDGWTDERVATLRIMWNGGATYNEIAYELGISRSCVAGKRKRMKLPPNGGARSLPLTPEERAERERVVREVIAAGGASREAARKLGCGIDAVFKVAKRLGLYWPQNYATRQQRPRKPAMSPLDRPSIKGVRQAPQTPPRLDVVPATATTLEHITSRQCHYPIGEPKGLDTVYCGAVRLTGSSYCPVHDRIVWTPALSEHTTKAYVA